MTLQISVGQAGAQVGSAIQQLTGRLTPPTANKASPPASGCVFVDSEPKAVLAVCSPDSPAYVPHVSRTSVVYDQNGRGNNWAWGYTSHATHLGTPAAAAGSVGPGRPTPAGRSGAPLQSRAVEAIRRQAEAQESCRSILFVHSLGGGTGSGVGSRLLELVRDEFADAVIVSACVAPFLAGDTPLQYYNMALSLATAHECADAVMLFDNDDLLHRSRVQLRWVSEHADKTKSVGGGAGAATSLERAAVHTRDLNAEMARAIAPLLSPTFRSRCSDGYRRRGVGDGAAGGDASRADSRPAWHDLREDLPADDAPFANAFTADDDAAGDADGGEGAAPFGSSNIRLPKGVFFDPDAGSYCVPYSALDASSLTSLVHALVPAPSTKYLDVRCADESYRCPAGPGGLCRRSNGSDIFGSASPWVELADHLVELMPRQRQGVLLAAHVVLRGVEDDQGAPSSDAAAAAALSRGQPGVRPLGAASVTARLGSSSRLGQAAGSGSSLQLLPGFPEAPGPASSKQQQTPLVRAQQWLTVSQKLHRAAGGGLPMARWSSETSAPWYCPERPCTISPGRSITLCSNSAWMVPTLARCAARATELLGARAYVHWYERFGIAGEHIQMAVDSVCDVVQAYGSMVPAR